MHAALTLSEAGFETVMVNCNPETVSTDYDTADRLCFEPLTFEDVLEVYHAEAQSGTVAGVIVQLGGQTPLGLAHRLQTAGVPIVGTSPGPSTWPRTAASSAGCSPTPGCPHRPSAPPPASMRRVRPQDGSATRCWCGRRMCSAAAAWRSCTTKSLQDYISRATELTPDHPVLVDRFLEDAVEIDVDALCDGDEVFIGGVMEHIEEAGIHSGDSACALPPVTLGRADLQMVRESTEALAKGYRRQGAAQRAVRAQGRHSLRARSQPARRPDRAVRIKATAVPLAKGMRPGHARVEHRAVA